MSDELVSGYDYVIKAPVRQAACWPIGSARTLQTRCSF